MSLIPGIHCFSFGAGKGQLLTNIYLLEGPQGSILIDSGLNIPGLFERLRSEFSAAGALLQDIRFIVLTHFHVDHIGMAARFKEVSGGKILMHHEESVIRQDLYNCGETPSPISEQRFFRRNGAPRHVISGLMVDEFTRQWSYVQHVPPPDQEIGEGTVIRNGRFSLLVLDTPGHSRGHVCLYEPNEKLLFSGDHVSLEPAHIGSNPSNSGNPWGDYIASLPKLLDLPVCLVQPGHGRPFTGLAERLQRQIASREKRQQAILDSLGHDFVTTYDVARGLIRGKDRNESEFDGLEDVRKRSEIYETAADMEFLCSIGMVLRAERRGSQILWRRAINGPHAPEHGTDCL